MNVELWTALLFLGLAVFLCAAGIGVSLLLSPHYYKPQGQYEAFECGVDTEGTGWVPFKGSHFLYALIFLLFDIEALFFFPIALIFKDIGLLPLVAAVVFLLVICLGLWYEWKEGALEWS